VIYDNLSCTEFGGKCTKEMNIAIKRMHSLSTPNTAHSLHIAGIYFLPMGGAECNRRSVRYNNPYCTHNDPKQPSYINDASEQKGPFFWAFVKCLV